MDEVNERAKGRETRYRLIAREIRLNRRRLYVRCGGVRWGKVNLKGPGGDRARDGGAARRYYIIAYGRTTASG